MSNEESVAVLRKRELEIARARDLDFMEALEEDEEDSERMELMLLLFASSQTKIMSKRAKRTARRRALQAAGLLSKPKRSKRKDTLPPSESAWNYFINGGDHPEESWFDWVGLPKHAFESLVESCQEIWSSEPLDDGDSPPRTYDLKRRSLDCKATVALLLTHLNKVMPAPELGKKFGLLEAGCQKHLDFAMRTMLPAMRKHPQAQIIWDVKNPVCLDRMAECIERCEPEMQQKLRGVRPVAWLDGVRFRIVNKSKADRSGEKKLSLRKMQLLFDPMGRCVAAVWNTPGSWGDGKCCSKGLLYDKINNELPNGFCVLVDTAHKGAVINSKIVRVLRKGEHLPAGMSLQELAEIEKSIIRCRQPSEWGNNQFMQFMHRLHAILRGDDICNGNLMELALRLHNFRVNNCDRNEVKRFFQNLEALEDDPELDDYLDSL